MEIFIMDEEFKSLYNVDNFKSLIWTERYNGCGNFEFYTPVNQGMLQIINVIQKKMENELDCYAWSKEAETFMVIEDLQITTDVDDGNYLIMSGRGLESILERRIIWERTVLNGDLQNGIEKLLNEAVISPKISDRKIPNFLFSRSTNEFIENLTIKAQYTGDNLYDVILAICETNQLGFDVTLDLNNNLIFSLNYGEDRSYDQNRNQYVVFSPKYENIINSDYLESAKTLKNVTLVAGEDRNLTGGSDSSGGRKYAVVGSATGMARRELFTDARDIQSETEDGKLSDDEYTSLLEQRGAEKLAKNAYTMAFTGEVETTKMFIYGRDFFKGDIVQLVNEYGMEAKIRILEIVRVQDTDGYSMYPTFQVVA